VGRAAGSSLRLSELTDNREWFDHGFEPERRQRRVEEKGKDPGERRKRVERGERGHVK